MFDSYYFLKNSYYYTWCVVYAANDYGHLPAQQPSTVMGGSQLYEPGTVNKTFTNEGHIRPLSFFSASGRQTEFINPLFDDYEDHETVGYAKPVSTAYTFTV